MQTADFFAIESFYKKFLTNFFLLKISILNILNYSKNDHTTQNRECLI